MTAAPGWDSARKGLGKAIGFVSLLLSLGGLVALFALGQWDFLVGTGAAYFGILGLGLGALGWLMVGPQPRNGAVWSIIWASFFAALFTAGVALTVLLTRSAIPGLTYEALRELSPSMLPRGAALAVQFRFWAVVPALWLPLTFGLLLFPDGRFARRRWNLVGWWSAVTITTATLATALANGPDSILPIKAADNTLPGPMGQVIDASFFLSSVAALLSVVSLIDRYRQSSGETRSQIRLVMWGGAFFAAALVLPLEASPVVTGVVGMVAFSVLVGSFAVAISRYRLYDIDVVVSRTVTYGVLAAFITGVYALVVVGLGSVLGRGEEPSLALSIVAVAVVAVAFEPLRSRVQRAANRLVFGERATPYEVLSRVTNRLADTGSPEEAIARVAQLVVEGTGASEVVMWVRVGDRLQPLLSVPPAEAVGESLALPEQGLPSVPGDGVVPVRHRDELLGAIAIVKPRGEALSAVDEKVLQDVAAGAGLLLRNISLNAALEERADQLRQSRRRMVAAHDEERHRLERDLHDGAQQQVVALKVKLGIARTLAQREGAEDLAGLAATLSDHIQETVDSMREVAHGIYPPLLEAEGLPTALAASWRRAGTTVALAVGDIRRFDRPIEESLYFCILDSVTRAVAAGGGSVAVGIEDAGDEAHFTVSFNGRVGDLMAVRDRIDAFGGALMVAEVAGRTVVNGRLPVPVTEGVPA